MLLFIPIFIVYVNFQSITSLYDIKLYIILHIKLSHPNFDANRL